MTPTLFSSRKLRGEKLAVLTAYDYPTARLLDEAGIDILLVGDSLGMVVLGFPDTTYVTIDDIIHHTAAVARGSKHAMIVADLPIDTYSTPDQAVAHAQRLLAAGADAVKLEGGASHAPQIAALAAHHIPIMAHIGMLPQSIREEGAYKIKGKTPADATKLLDDALAVEAAGAFAVVLELVQADVSQQITAALKIPTIGIGSGKHCDGQVLVTHDLIGFFPWFTPKFVTPLAHVGASIQDAVRAFIHSTQTPPTLP